jgi:putative ABC transport system permease protein
MAGATRQSHNWVIVGRLKPGVTREGAQRQVDVISKRLERQYPASNTNKALQLDPLQAALAEQQRPQLLVLMAAVGLVLLIACANVAGLLLARGSVRRLELAMRAALGASRVRITRQLLVESVTLALLSGVLGMAIAFWLNRLLPLATGLGDPGSVPKGLDWPVLLFALALSVLTGVLFGVAPALRGSSSHLIQDIAAGVRTTDTKTRVSLRSVLVVGQVAVSLMLLVGAGLLIRGFVHLARTNPGFDVQHLLTGEIQLLETQYPNRNQRIQFFDGLSEDLAAIHGVKAVGFISQLPIRDPWNNNTVWDADHPPENLKLAGAPSADQRIVLPGYFDALHIPLTIGRDFEKSDRKNAPLTIVINGKMARTLFPGLNPLGRRVSVDMGGPQPTTFEVVGVVGDAHIDSVGDSAPMTIYLSYYQFPDTTLRFAIRTAQDPELITQSVRRLVLAHDRTVPVENLVSMEKLIGDSLAPQRTTSVTLALFATVALMLACIGLYGVLAYSVSQRTHEIGVRMALGANRREVLRLVLKQGMTLALAGMAVGMVAAFGLTRLLKNMLFDVAPNDPATFVAVSGLLTLVAALACAIPARRATKVDPMVALRHE